tara:strand:- start:352 stop:570 length:219 start_codon:yes stop_codon:yes gene_type:complete
MSWIKRLFSKKPLNKQCDIHCVSSSYNCLGCNKVVDGGDYLYIKVFRDEFAKNRCKKCVTEIVESGKLVEIL